MSREEKNILSNHNSKVKFIEDPWNGLTPELSKEELKNLIFNKETSDSRFELITETESPKVVLETKILYKDKETGKYYCSWLKFSLKDEKTYIGTTVEVERTERQETQVSYSGKVRKNSISCVWKDFKTIKVDYKK